MTESYFTQMERDEAEQRRLAEEELIRRFAEAPDYTAEVIGVPVVQWLCPNPLCYCLNHSAYYGRRPCFQCGITVDVRRDG